ncbi:MAG TPA: glycosyltransferase family 39 protein [Victivallales bacterium]|nr:glycosyltransferase family 39 protein [Victivallales bacterium]
MENSTSEYNHKSSGILFDKEIVILFIFILISLTISFYPVHYGYFRDELYYIALSKHLAWGYIDVPPLMPFCIAIMGKLFGYSLTAIHILPALIGVIILILTRSLVKKLGGGVFAQVLALTCMTFAPIYDVQLSTVTYDIFNRLFWVLAIYSVVCLLKTDNKKYWIYFGIFAGLGAMSKFDMFWLGGGIVIALILTNHRRNFLRKELWLGALIAFLILLPYLIWIVKTNFLTLQYFINYSHETAPINFISFFKAQFTAMNMISLPVWLVGLYYFIFNRTGKTYRLMGITYLAIAVLCVAMQTKFYVITPFYFILYVGGAVYIDKITSKQKLIWLKTIYCCLIIIGGLIMLPAVRPILPVNTAVKYISYIMPPSKRIATEDWKPSALPQILADRFGWKEMTAKVAKIYYSLPEKQRINTYIYTSNYGEASGIAFYRKKYKLPMPLSEHLQYYVWGYRGADKKSTFIVTGWSKNALKSFFEKVNKAGQINSRYGMQYENRPIYLCKGLKIPIGKFWQKNIDMHM